MVEDSTGYAPPSYDEATGYCPVTRTDENEENGAKKISTQTDNTAQYKFSDFKRTPTISFGVPETASSSAVPYSAPQNTTAVSLAQSDALIRSGQNKDNQWSHGLLECFSGPSEACFGQFCCPCIMEYRVAKQANVRRVADGLAVTSIVGGTLIAVAFLVFVIIEANLPNLENSSSDDVYDSRDWWKDGESEDDYDDYEFDPDVNFRKMTTHFEMFGLVILSLVFCVLKIIRVFLGFYLRQHIRKVHRIGLKDSVISTAIEDAISVVLCYDCTICQEKSTMDQQQRERAFYSQVMEQD
ncbi:uncharacterized protein LOC142353580 [Convolutriloba macropyga]|uniref:uncharacterized protein LOC142353580 n=1 Tax=Convolutriloba macropyga TaxID=536237 RepID=UPI003F522F2B